MFEEILQQISRDVKGCKEETSEIMMNPVTENENFQRF